MGGLAVFLSCEKKDTEMALSWLVIHQLIVYFTGLSPVSQRPTHHNESLVLNALVCLGISQPLQDMEALLDGLQGALKEAEFLL